MMKKVLWVMLFTFMGWSANAQVKVANEKKTTEAVLINGIWWASCNVGEKGTFVSSPKEYGNYYTFEEAQSACPKGWRVPTKEEFELLNNAGNVWMTLGGVGGRYFGVGPNSIFLPAAGLLLDNGELYQGGSYGAYNSSTPSDGGVFGLYFNFEFANPNDDTFQPLESNTVRCVAEK